MSFMDIYRHWLEQVSENEELAAELRSIEQNEAAIEDRFYRDWEFGTGGLWGVSRSKTGVRGSCCASQTACGRTCFVTPREMAGRAV